MKNKLHRLPKELRLMLLLGLMALMVLCLWLEADTPAFSPKGALHEAEQICLLEQGKFLCSTYDFPDTEWDTRFYPAVSRTKTQLHMTEVKREGLWWQPSERALSVPIEQPMTAALLPWQINIENDNTCYPAVVVYCPEAANVTATMTIGGNELPPRTFSGRTGKGENGCFLVAFENLYVSEARHLYLAVYQNLGFYYHRQISLGTAYIQVDLTVYDQAGDLLAQKTLFYSDPAQ